MYVNYTHVKCTFDNNLLVSVSVSVAVSAAAAAEVAVAAAVDCAAGVAVSGIGKAVAGSFMVAIN